MKEQIIIQIVTYLLKSLTAVEFKHVIDGMLDSLEGIDNEKQRSWHRMIRVILNVPDND